MKKTNQIIIIFILFPIIFLLGNLSSDLFSLKVSLGELFVFKKDNNSFLKANFTKDEVKNKSDVVGMEFTRSVSQTTTKKVGENYKLGNIEYKVISAVNKGSKYENRETKGKFISVKILLSNIGKINSKGSKIILKDKMDRQFEKMEYFIFGFNLKEKEYSFNFFSDDIAPGFSETYTAVFEVPKDSADLKLCHPSTTGVDIVCVKLGL